jgi:hypothetical protein
MYPADTPASGQNRRRTVRRSTPPGFSRRPPEESVHDRATRRRNRLTWALGGDGRG